MRVAPLYLVLAVALGLFSTAALAAQGQGHNRYKWHDSQGNLHFSDTLPADASRYGYEVVNAHGIVIKHVDRAQTPEEQASARAELAKSRAAEQRAASAVRTDQQLMVAYPTEADLARAQQQQLDLLDQGIKAAQINLQTQETGLADLLDHAAEFDRDNKPVPAELARQIGEMRIRTRDQRDMVSRQQAEREDVVRKFADDMAHYRELRSASADPQH